MFFHHKLDKKVCLNIKLKPCVFSITQPESETNFRATFVVSFSIINVLDKFHHFHHLEFHQLVFTEEYHVSMSQPGY